MARIPRLEHFAFHTRTCRGAYLLELALVLPIFLAFVFFLLWIAIQVHLIISFNTSVNNAVRLGASRGDAKTLGYTSNASLYGLIPAIHRTPFWSPEVAGIFCHNVDSAVCRAYYDTWSQALYNLPFESLPHTTHYAIAYAVESNLIGSGAAAVRFPCNTDGDPSTGDTGAGCLDCRTFPETALGPVPQTKSRLILECRFQPDSWLFGMVMGIVSRGAAQGSRYVLRRRMFFDRAVYDHS